MDKVGNNMVTVTCGTKFHSDYTAFQLQQHNLLEKVITAHPSKKYLNRVSIEKKRAKFLAPIFVPAYLLSRIFSGSNFMVKWLDNNMPILFDLLAAKNVKRSKIILAYAWSALESIKTVKKNGGIALVEECGSCNKYQNEILDEEYRKLGLTFKSPTPDFIVKRQLTEAELADYLLCPSNHVIGSFVENGIDRAKCILIPYGVNKDIFKAYHLHKDEFTIICVGTIGVRKGQYYLFEALQQLAQRIAVKCILIGKVEDQFIAYYNQYKHLFTHYDYIPHQELVNYYNKASVFVLPSLDEGLALVQLEAMACGLPIISTPNAGADAIIDDRKEGYIVPIKDASAIANRIEMLYNDHILLKKMSENAICKSEKFSWDNYGEKLADFINSL
ncbi:glycosyltransferase involved in cell wall biosynthesis [Pedobacter sp. W3I1]|uniref:glycosyltransferase family 4 protein n=1 Tax=Pedobacter sp. W3I1 TaxID=3042291 RepID=UPI002783B21D|nr:glycosyltransferase family 4 protein [Pedobacter sp. W3I1]MDQ0640913.1 glycosyltransferase involved in cell wall biosynthesis [Pedobacter sp. W3I1]